MSSIYARGCVWSKTKAYMIASTGPLAAIMMPSRLSYLMPKKSPWNGSSKISNDNSVMQKRRPSKNMVGKSSWSSSKSAWQSKPNDISEVIVGLVLGGHRRLGMAATTPKEFVLVVHLQGTVPR